jgi:hypothetical protein
MSARPVRLILLGAAALGFAAPALAQQLPPPPAHPGVMDAAGRVYDAAPPAGLPDHRPEWRGAPQQAGHPAAHHPQGQPGYDRAAWEQAQASWLSECRRRHGNGNKVGKHHRGADQQSVSDWCESYLKQHTTWGHGYGQAHAQGVVGYGYAPMTVMVPVAYVQVATTAPAQQRECVETIVTEEWVAVPGRTRYIAPRPKPRPDKRVRIVPDKRVRVN